MPSSLSNLVTDLKTSGIDKFKCINEEFKDNTEKMTRKGRGYIHIITWIVERSLTKHYRFTNRRFQK